MAKKKNLSVKFDSNLITALAYIIIGILCCVLRAGVFQIVLTIVGVLFVVQGVLNVLSKDWVQAAINLVIGIVILSLTWIIDEIMLLIFGIMIMIKGAYELYNALKAKSKDMISLIAAAVTMVVGILLIVARWQTVDTIFIIIGIIFIVNGVFELLGKKK